MKYKNLLNPVFLFKYLREHRVINFLLVGSSGVLIQLIVTWIFITFFFGETQKFESYIVGLLCNLAYNFTLYSISTFKTTRNHVKRFAIYIIYSLSMASFQAFIINQLNTLFDPPVYLFLFMLAGVVLIFSVVTFLLFKFWLFRE